jgi:predicted O-methyltransferase YrrM
MGSFRQRTLGSQFRYDVQRRLWELRTRGWHSPLKTYFARDARPGEAAELFADLAAVPGWFTYDDLASFLLVLRYQTAVGITGDVLEIGTYYGRSTSALARGLAGDERLIVCDPFVDYRSGERAPTAAGLRATVRRTNPGFDMARLDVRSQSSRDLELASDTQLRFAHVDGSHDHDDALADLRLVYGHLVPGGVLAVDDYEHPQWPDVTRAVHAFLGSAADMREIGDMNRRGESGRKLYLARLAG